MSSRSEVKEMSWEREEMGKRREMKRGSRALNAVFHNRNDAAERE